jgi:hypothetical protein
MWCMRTACFYEHWSSSGVYKIAVEIMALLFGSSIFLLFPCLCPMLMGCSSYFVLCSCYEGFIKQAAYNTANSTGLNKYCVAGCYYRIS